MPEVHVKFFDHAIEVDDDEVESLRRQGLLVEDKPAPEPPARVVIRPASRRSTDR